MRLSAPLLVISAALAAVWAQASLPPAQNPYDDPDLAPASASDGLSARLSELGAPLSGALATTEGADGTWRLRGRTALPDGARAGWPVALYAEARLSCDADLGRSACWQVTLLEIDGAPALPAPALSGAAVPDAALSEAALPAPALPVLADAAVRP